MQPRPTQYCISALRRVMRMQTLPSLTIQASGVMPATRSTPPTLPTPPNTAGSCERRRGNSADRLLRRSCLAPFRPPIGPRIPFDVFCTVNFAAVMFDHSCVVGVKTRPRPIIAVPPANAVRTGWPPANARWIFHFFFAIGIGTVNFNSGGHA